ncbi:PEP-CTERM sorting domain-containing protein [Deefgea tanakiae]|uniref:PEP-CTERM sorting domain-containing protein n=1 Tax=Deefgea tanakiae TaxID=2865840 RepID=A0ABX8Z6M8_9NEIS|nr:PEP-CTERM sorting domain-containing protein [Deefgea tanakiae]QZA78223.1 PEP-CTERM sorting domain-containing protein [Deefgea tanakiae]
MLQLISSVFLVLLCLQSHASILQQQVVVDAPAISVLAGKQDNGNVAIEQLFTANTTQAQDILASSTPLSSSTLFGGSKQGGTPSAFSFPDTLTTPPKPIAPPTATIPPPIIPAVPEPETYALMAIGLTGLLLARRKRAYHAQKNQSRTE